MMGGGTVWGGGGTVWGVGEQSGGVGEQSGSLMRRVARSGRAGGRSVAQACQKHK